MSEIVNKIKDALIHFEDKKYLIHAYQFIVCDGMNGSSRMIYPLIKKIENDEPVNMEIGYHIQITAPWDDPKVKSYQEFIWFNNALITAVKRITDDTDNIVIDRSNRETGLYIPHKSFEIYNIKSLADMCKNFNRKGLGSNIVPSMNEEGDIHLKLHKAGKEENSDMIKLAEESGFKIEKIVNIDPIIAELSLDELKNDEKTFSIYEK